MNPEIWKQTTRSLASEMARERHMKADEILVLERFVNYGARELESRQKAQKDGQKEKKVVAA